MNQIVAIGEVLWDVFRTGPRFGGAPANFACTYAGLGGERAKVAMVSAVGIDRLGRDALAALRQHQVETDCVQQRVEPTGKVLIELDAAGAASYEFESDCAWDNLSWSPQLDRLARSADVVCFGTLGQRSVTAADTIQQFLAATRPETLRLFDINLRPPFYEDQTILQSLAAANALKLNDEELPLVAQLCGLQGSETELLQQLLAQYQLQVIALTRGANGAVLVRDGEVHEHRGVSTAVVDTVGAGDAYTATLAMGMLHHCSLSTINQAACEVAAFVCSQSGATPQLPAGLADAVLRT